jgi:hypothetical protein
MKKVLMLAVIAACVAAAGFTVSRAIARIPHDSIVWREGLPFCNGVLAGADEAAAIRGAADVAVCPDKP